MGKRRALLLSGLLIVGACREVRDSGWSADVAGLSMRVATLDNAERALSGVKLEVTLENVGREPLLVIPEAVRFELRGGSPPARHEGDSKPLDTRPWATARRLAPGERLEIVRSPAHDAGGYWTVGNGLISISPRYELLDVGPVPEPLLRSTGRPRLWLGTLRAPPLRLRSRIDDEELPEWLREKPDASPEIPPRWFNQHLAQELAGAQHIRILLDGELVATESSVTSVEALLGSLEFGGRPVGRGGICRCVPRLQLEVYTSSGAETISPVCGSRFRLGALETDIKWPDPFLTPAALAAFRRWVEDHGVPWECCGGS
jgi:hypothetical protein